MAKESKLSLSENNIVFSKDALKDYRYWLKTDKKIHAKINDLIDDIIAHPFVGLGKPEPLRWLLVGCWSRRIDQQHRLVYRINNNKLEIISCRYHYK